MQKPTLYIVMPAYNEAENIRETVANWYPLLVRGGADSRLVIADTGSTDDTHKILQNLKKTYPKLETLSTSDKQHGPKVIALYNYAIKNRADYIFQTDSDGQTNPAEFDTFWNARKEYDIILGNRAQRGDGKSRAFVEKIVCRLLNIFYHVKIPDANAPFRLMKTEVVEKYIGFLPKDYNLPNIILSAFFVNGQEKVKFVSISFKPRTAGKNSINIPKIVNIGAHALVDFNKFRKYMK